MSPLRVALLWPCERDPWRIRELGAQLVAMGEQPRMITSHRRPPGTTFEDGLEIAHIWRPPDGRLRRRAFEAPITHVPATYLSLRRGSADLAHAFHAPDAVAGVRWSERSGRPIVFSFMGAPTRRWLVARRWRLASIMAATQGATAVVSPSRFAAETFSATLGVSARVINPGIDYRRSLGAAARSPSPSILCVAAPGEELRLLVGALRIVRRRHPDTVLLLPRGQVTAGAMSGEPGVEPTEVDPAAYARAWVSLLPGGDRGFPLALLESLANGTPVVASANGVAAELVDRPGLGSLYEAPEPAAVARSLLEAIAPGSSPGPSPDTIAKCRARAADFSVQRCARAYDELYHELLDSRP